LSAWRRCDIRYDPQHDLNEPAVAKNVWYFFFFFFLEDLADLCTEIWGPLRPVRTRAALGRLICRNYNARGDHAVAQRGVKKQKSQPPIAFRHSGGPHHRGEHPTHTGPCTSGNLLLQRGGSSPSNLATLPFGCCMSKGSRSQSPGAVETRPPVSA
jgi:hypothetical protein